MRKTRLNRSRHKEDMQDMQYELVVDYHFYSSYLHVYFRVQNVLTFSVTVISAVPKLKPTPEL